MKYFFTGIAALATGLSTFAQPNCQQIIQASFTASVQGPVVVLTNSSQSMFPQATTYQWVFGDGEVASGSVVQHTYNAPGTYQLCLYAIVENCVDTTCQQVLIGGGPSPCDSLDAEFTFTSDGAEVSFDNAASSNLFAYQWYFGDGTTAFGQDPAHTYAEPGTYAACLVMWTWDPQTQDTCFAENCEIVVVDDGDPCSALEAGFIANTYPLGAEFSNTTAGTGFQTTWSWSFGDGSTSNDPQPTHTYDLPGAYYVCLAAMSIYEQQGGGVITCVDSICQQVFIPGSSSPCDSLSAFFVATTETNVTAFSAFGGTASGYEWSFGDGTGGSGAALTHTYPGPGTYNACLVTWTWDPQTQDTCYADQCLWITISGGDPCDTIQSCFTWEDNGTSVFFDNCSNMNGMGPWYQWDFGDGTLSDAISPTHMYPGPGTYTVCLTGWLANSPDSCSSTLCQVVLVGAGSPCDSLSADFVVTTENNLAAFTSFGGSAIGYQWNFGDGTEGDGPSPVHTYPGPGSYHACLITWTWDPQTQDTCYADHCEWITIGQAGACDSTFACFQWGLEDNVAQFFNCSSSNNGQLAYWWSFGDGTFSDSPEPAHTYPGPGSYTVCLTVTVGNELDSCSSTSCNTLVIQGASSPCDSLEAGFQTNVGNATVFFSNNTSGTGFQTTWHWNFGDGTSSDDAQPSHVFPGLGSYVVCLTVTTLFEQQGGGLVTCQDSTCQVVFTGGGSPCDSLSAYFVVTTQENLSAFTTFGGTALGYHWDFGDGTTGQEAAPTHTFPGPGAYHACLFTWTWDPQTQDTCYADHCEWIIIGGGDPCDTIQSCFTWEDNGASVFFDNCSSMNGMGPWYQWDFGDGTQSDAISPTHTYPGPGTYTVCLTGWLANSPDSCSSTVCQVVLVGGDSPCDGLSAEFTVTGIETQAVFTGSGGTAIGYHWNFGDGEQGDGPNPVHVYPGPGTYNACLLTWTWDPQTQDTCYADHCELVTIGGGAPCDSLEAHFVWEPAGQNVFLFQDASITGGQNVIWQWSFGDGQFSDTPDPVHTFAQPGQYEVCLTITSLDSPDSCSSTTCQLIIVQGGGSPCDSLWVADFEFGHQGTVYTFFNTSTTPNTEVSTHWDFGDGTGGDDSQVVHTYAQSGTYTVCMTISGLVPGSEDSCQVTVCQTIEISTGIQDANGSMAVAAWPQPFEELLQVEGVGLHGLTRFTLLDMTGRVVSDQRLAAQGRITLRYDHVPTGAYVLHLHNDTLDRTVRVVKR